MGSTANFNWPTPELSVAADVPADMKALADAADATVATFASAPVGTAGSLPVSGVAGQRIYIEDINTFAYWDEGLGSWEGYYKAYTPTVANTTSPTLACKRLINGEEVTVKFLITLTAAVTSTLTMSLPVAPHADVNSEQHLGGVDLRDASGGAARHSAFATRSGATSNVLFYYDATAATTSFVTSGANPWTWAAGDTIGGEIRYQRAA